MRHLRHQTRDRGHTSRPARRRATVLLAAAALVLGSAAALPAAQADVAASRGGRTDDTGASKPAVTPAATGQDVAPAAGAAAGSATPAKPSRAAQAASTTAGGSPAGAPSDLPAGPPSTDPALAPTDLGDLAQDQGALGALRAAAVKAGSVRVVVTFATDFTSLGATTSAAAAQQRATVQALSDRVGGLATGRGATVNRTYGGNIPAIALSATPDALDALAASPDVARIDPDAENAPVDTTTNPLIGAADAQDRGFHGAASGVAILDTGTQFNHPAFGSRVRWTSCFSAGNGCPDGTSAQIGGNAGIPCTYSGDCSHGTHVAGIAAGAGSVPGVADQAVITAVQVFHRATCNGVTCALAYDSDILAALNWAYDYRSIGYAAVNISIGGGQYTGSCDSDKASLKTAIDNLRSVGIATAIAAGNNGYTNATTAPGCISTAITVGATDNSDAVAGFSNSSPIVDLYAPGVSVQSSIPGGGYAYYSGTSMATPQVVGSIAQLKSAQPGLSVAQEEAALGASGPTITDSKSGLARHRINVLQAMGQELITLANDGPRDLRNPIPIAHRFQTTTGAPYWSAVAIRPPVGGDDDLRVYDNADLSGLLATSAYGANAVDFVAQDGNRRGRPDATFPYVSQYNGSGRYQVDYADDATTVGDSTSTTTMGYSDVIEIRDSYETAGVPTYYRVVPSNGQDVEMFLMESTAGTATSYVKPRSGASATASSAGAGGAEGFSHTSATTQYQGLVLVNKAGSGSYTLYRDTSAPSGSVSIDGGAASTADRVVDLAISGSDAQTGVQDMQVSVDGVLDTEAWEPYSTSRTVTLPNGGGDKTVLVAVRNNAGMVSQVSDTITLVATAPGAPTVTGSTPSTGAVTVAFDPPASDGNSPITSWTAGCTSTDGGTARSKAGTGSPITVSGLSPAKTYHCRVRATNSVGTGAWSSYGSTVVVPASKPGAPAVTGSTPTAGAVTVGFTPPASDGGSPITGYQVSCASTDGGVTRSRTGSTSPIRVTALTAGKSYHCRARATNAAGTGAYGAFGDTVVLPPALG